MELTGHIVFGLIVFILWLAGSIFYMADLYLRNEKGDDDAN